MIASETREARNNPAGVPGIGKTLTLRELARTAEAEWGVRRVVALNCMKNPETVPQQILDGLGGAAQYAAAKEAASVRTARVGPRTTALPRLAPLPASRALAQPSFRCAWGIPGRLKRRRRARSRFVSTLTPPLALLWHRWRGTRRSRPSSGS